MPPQPRTAAVPRRARARRDKLMPVRSWVQRTIPGMAGVTRRGVEDAGVGVPGVCNFVDARTKWIDGALRQALDEGFTQVVCLAAGYDTRAYRFARRGVKFFELDLPAASQRKQWLVKACLPGYDTLPRPVYVGADLGRVTVGDALAGTGFDASRPTLFTCEGLIYYLPEAAVATLLTSVADVAAPGSRLLFDFLHADAVDGSAFYPGYHACAESVAGKGEAFVSGLQPGEDELAGYLALLSWRLHRLVSPRQMAAKELPHEQWSDEIPPILAFYSYCEMEKPAVAAAAPAGASVAAPASVKQQPEPACLQRDGSLIQAAPDADLPGSP
ncbi:hypothetical protein CHLNCDRAFT_53521 [Chlorella variabilis]|uniref:S-adenosyl-L-methionine-dependent methyltransferase n=1 Tax=Chlorella variabilis TaxID=554065 RepID=E1ZK48_CHLVA|nr:hypothetical protein CHLNCDRAFT_53521 [Chlorella variabilis]EFN53633.1 hypothetical protein CHLNCDRAFT_53521 [Chlorella variabilis]|eukprot:XP_005845735.1 hypothetical protein CHLNCDRAFT_53521 [Chlorella variabilis]